LKEEELVSKRKVKGLMDMYHETIYKAIFISKMFWPLHRKLRNLYRQNIAHQAQIKELKTKL
jgi:hypothetical protein